MRSTSVFTTLSIRHALLVLLLRSTLFPLICFIGFRTNLQTNKRADNRALAVQLSVRQSHTYRIQPLNNTALLRCYLFHVECCIIAAYVYCHFTFELYSKFVFSSRAHSKVNKKKKKLKYVYISMVSIWSNVMHAICDMRLRR